MFFHPQDFNPNLVQKKQANSTPTNNLLVQQISYRITNETLTGYKRGVGLCKIEIFFLKKRVSTKIAINHQSPAKWSPELVKESLSEGDMVL